MPFFNAVNPKINFVVLAVQQVLAQLIAQEVQASLVQQREQASLVEQQGLAWLVEQQQAQSAVRFDPLVASLAQQFGQLAAFEQQALRFDLGLGRYCHIRLKQWLPRKVQQLIRTSSY